MAYVVDADGERKIVRVKGWDMADPEAVYEGWIEVRRGGMQVFHALDNRPVTVSAPPAVPTADEIREQREARQAEYVEKEQQAAEQERAAQAAKQAEIAQKRESRRAAREAAQAESETPSAA